MLLRKSAPSDTTSHYLRVHKYIGTYKCVLQKKKKTNNKLTNNIYLHTYEPHFAFKTLNNRKYKSTHMRVILNNKSSKRVLKILDERHVRLIMVIIKLRIQLLL